MSEILSNIGGVLMALTSCPIKKSKLLLIKGTKINSTLTGLGAPAFIIQAPASSVKKCERILGVKCGDRPSMIRNWLSVINSEHEG